MFIQNSYHSNDFRMSFEILINKCSVEMVNHHTNQTDNQCASDAEIQKVSHELIFNMYFLHKKADFSVGLDQKPYKVELEFA